MPSISEIRARYPSLQEGFAFMDNAGGTQVSAGVADAMRDYMLRSYVQVGADYPASVRATETVARAHDFIERLMGGGNAGRAILGPSSSSLFRMLADCYAEVLQPGDEIIVALNGHEANTSPWLNLQKRGHKIVMWQADPHTGTCENLDNLLTERTKLVVFPHASNILGKVENLQDTVAQAHAAKARVVVDGVAYAPHLAMRCKEWNVDWYGFSCYKVFGPHIAALWGTHEAQAELTGPGHSIVPRSEIPYKFELGGVNHEACAGLLAVESYLNDLGGSVDECRTFEEPLTERFLSFLRSNPKARVIGPNEMSPDRLPILSFVHDTIPTKAIADEAAKHDIGMRWGNFYSYRLVERLGLDPTTGVARASFAHYNTVEEVERLIAALEPLLK